MPLLAEECEREKERDRGKKKYFKSFAHSLLWSPCAKATLRSNLMPIAEQHMHAQSPRIPHAIATNHFFISTCNIFFFQCRHLSLIAFLCLLFGIGTCPRKSSATAPPSCSPFTRDSQREREKEREREGQRHRERERERERQRVREIARGE